MKFVIQFLLLLSLYSCKNSKGDKNNGMPDLPDDQLQSISENICPENQSLVLVDTDKQLLRDLPKVIAFASGSSACALNESINDEWYGLFGARSFFKIEIQECLMNNSIWTFKTGSSQDHTIDFTYQDFEQTKEIKISASDEVQSAYARDHAGLRLLECQ